MRALLVSPLGFLIGVSLGALGGGGSILAVPALVYAAGQDPKAATTTSLLIVGASALIGMAAHWRAGRVRVVPGLLFGGVGIGGSLLGSSLNESVDPDVLLLAFSGLMLVAAWRMHAGTKRSAAPAGAVAPTHDPTLPTPPAPTGGPGERIGATASAPSAAATAATVTAPTAAAPTRPHIDVATVVKVLLAGTAVGFLTGFFGVGGGFVVVPALVLALRFPMPEAVGTSLLVIAINSAFALSTRLATTGIEWDVALPFTLASIAGVVTGTRMASRVPAAKLSRWFVVLLVAVAVYTATQSLLAVL